MRGPLVLHARWHCILSLAFSPLAQRLIDLACALNYPSTHKPSLSSRDSTRTSETMASLDAHQWNCTGCREGSTAPSRHNHEKGSCQFFFDPNQAATNVNPHEGSTPRRPRQHLVMEEDWAESTKRRRGYGPHGMSRDYGRNRYLAFQAPIRSSTVVPCRPGSSRVARPGASSQTTPP